MHAPVDLKEKKHVKNTHKKHLTQRAYHGRNNGPRLSDIKSKNHVHTASKIPTADNGGRAQ